MQTNWQVGGVDSGVCLYATNGVNQYVEQAVIAPHSVCFQQYQDYEKLPVWLKILKVVNM